MTVKEIRDITGLSRAAFSRLYNIPLRTIEDWDYGKNTPPPYVVAFLERIVKLDFEEKSKK